MNIDRGIADRALLRAGQEALTEDDITNLSANFRAVKQFYLQTILETLEKTEWTCCKKRASLVQAAENLSEYSFAYTLPADCAHPVELVNNGSYIIEGRLLYTDSENASLIYISNGKIEDSAEYITGDDYPAYSGINLDAKLSEYIETVLAGKIAFKISGDKQLYQVLTQQAMIIEDEAESISFAAGRNKKAGQSWWDDRISRC